jgi:putative endonuclease
MQYMAVYILLCTDNSYYIGVTNDLERRVWEHENGYNSKAYTFKRRPVKLVFYEYFPNASQAIEFEKQIKGWRREKKEALIKREWEKLPELSISYQKLKGIVK